MIPAISNDSKEFRKMLLSKINKHLTLSLLKDTIVPWDCSNIK